MTTLLHGGRAPTPARRLRTTQAGPVPLGRLPQVVTLVVLVAALAGAALAGVRLAGPAGTLPGEVPLSFGGAVVGTPTAAKATPSAAEHGLTSAAATARDGHRVVVPVTLVNRSAAAVGYRPEQFRLSVDGVADPATPGENPLARGVLLPQAAVALRLVFTVPPDATAARLALDPTDPARSVDLPLPGAAPAVPPAAATQPGDHATH